MKVRLPYKVNKDGRDEIKRQCIELNREYLEDLEYAVAWVLHKKHGYGIKRLRKFREDFKEEITAMTEFYETDDIYPARKILKDMGYEVEVTDE